MLSNDSESNQPENLSRAQPWVQVTKDQVTRSGQCYYSGEYLIEVRYCRWGITICFLLVAIISSQEHYSFFYIFIYTYISDLANFDKI